VRHLALAALLVSGCAPVEVSMDAAGLDATAPTCTDGLHNGDETDVDCGGPCPACGVGGLCLADTDCESQWCNSGGRCHPPSCRDGRRNGDEVGVDCGGSCRLCRAGKRCEIDAHCDRGRCESGICRTCSDGHLSPAEGGLDCGGVCGDQCANGVPCLRDDVCQGGFCVEGRCRGPSCHDRIQNGDEEGVDCGGRCQACPGPPCGEDADCPGGSCWMGFCADCDDGVRSWGEQRADCGGPCEACPPRCDRGEECSTGYCARGYCAPAPSCDAAVPLSNGVRRVRHRPPHLYGPTVSCDFAETFTQFSYTATHTGSVRYRVEPDDGRPVVFVVGAAGCGPVFAELHCDGHWSGRSLEGSFPVVAGETYPLYLGGRLVPPEAVLRGAKIELRAIP